MERIVRCDGESHTIFLHQSGRNVGAEAKKCKIFFGRKTKPGMLGDMVLLWKNYRDREVFVAPRNRAAGIGLQAGCPRYGTWSAPLRVGQHLTET